MITASKRSRFFWFKLKPGGSGHHKNLKEIKDFKVGEEKEFFSGLQKGRRKNCGMIGKVPK